MPAPLFSTSTPANGATNVAKNITLRVTFTEALLASTVSPRTVFLKYTPIQDQRVLCAVSLSDDQLTITVVPNEHLIENASYQLIVVGTDLSSTVRVTSTDDTPLALSKRISFQTGTSLTVDGTPDIKTEAETTLEGDAILPDDLGFRSSPGAPLRLIRTSPKQHAFGIPITTSRLRLEFSSPVDIDTVTGNIELTTMAYYGQEDYRAIKTDLGAGEDLIHYFQYETGAYTGGANGYLDPALFGDPTYTLSTEGNYVDINLVPLTGSVLPYNICFEVSINDQVQDLTGNYHLDSLVYFTCTKPYPEWASVGQVRHEVGAFAAADTPDDFIGLRTWQASIDVWEQLLGTINLVLPTQYHRIYVRLRAALDVYDDLMAVKYINSGVVKELGDLRIQYNTGAGGARPRKVKELEERLLKLYYVVFGGFTQQPRTGVRSDLDPMEPDRRYFRERLWRAELFQKRGEAGLAGRLAANTLYSRRQSSSGYYSTQGESWIAK